jgi:hypothetical protein
MSRHNAKIYSSYMTDRMNTWYSSEEIKIIAVKISSHASQPENN